MKFFLPLILFFILIAPVHAADQKTPNPQETLVLENFSEADVNSDDSLDADEFETFINLQAEDKIGKSRTITRFKAYKRAMDKVDADENGKVSLEEIAAVQSK